jgi:hypothetical protein
VVNAITYELVVFFELFSRDRKRPERTSCVLRAWMGDEVEISTASFFKLISWERGPEVPTSCVPG